jgi:hypothetical protein
MMRVAPHPAETMLRTLDNLHRGLGGVLAAGLNVKPAAWPEICALARDLDALIAANLEAPPNLHANTSSEAKNRASARRTTDFAQ